MHPLQYLVEQLIGLYTWVVIAAAIASWLVAFGVLNVRNQFVRTIVDVLYRLTEPVLRPIRRILPNLGGVDLSPIVVLLGLQFLEQVLRWYLWPYFY